MKNSSSVASFHVLIDFLSRRFLYIPALALGSQVLTVYPLAPKTGGKPCSSSASSWSSSAAYFTETLKKSLFLRDVKTINMLLNKILSSPIFITT